MTCIWRELCLLEAVFCVTRAFLPSGLMLVRVQVAAAPLVASRLTAEGDRLGNVGLRLWGTRETGEREGSVRSKLADGVGLRPTGDLEGRLGTW